MAKQIDPAASTRDEAGEQEAYLARLAEIQRRQNELQASLEARLKTINELAPIEVQFLENVNDLLIKEKEELRARNAEVERARTAILETNKVLLKQKEIEEEEFKLLQENINLTLEKLALEDKLKDKREAAAEAEAALAKERKSFTEAQQQSQQTLNDLKQAELDLEILKIRLAKDANSVETYEIIQAGGKLAALKKTLVTQQQNEEAQKAITELARKAAESAKTEVETTEEQIANKNRLVDTNRAIIAQNKELIGNAKERQEFEKAELEIRLHNQRAAQIQEKTQEKLLSIVGQAYKLQDSYIGSFIALTANSERSINGIFDAFGKQFKNVEVAYGTFFKTVENGMTSLSGKFMEFVNFEKDLILGVDKAAAAFNKVTGRGTEFREVFEKINTTQATSLEQFTEYNIGLDRVQSGFTDLYTSYNRFRDVATDPAISMGLVLATQKLANLGLSAQKFGSLATSLGGSITKTTTDAIKFGEDMVQTMLRTGKSMETLAGDFESFKDRFVVYGQTGVKVFNDLQIMAERMGLSFSSLVNVTTAFDKFEEGAKRAGQINAALGGAYVNSLDLMNMKENERVLYLKRSFEQTGMNFNSLNKYSQEFVASAFGIKSVAEAQNLFSMSTAQLTSELTKRNAEQKKLDDIAKNSADVMEQIKLFGQTLLIGIGPIFEALNSFVKTMKENPAILTSLKIIATIALGLGAVVKIFTISIGIIGAMKAGATIIGLLLTGQLKSVAELLQKKKSEEVDQAQLNRLTEARLRTEGLITQQYETRARLMGIQVPPSPVPITGATTALSPSTAQTTAPTGKERFLTGAGGFATAAGSVGMVAGVASMYVEDGGLKKFLQALAGVATIASGIIGIMAAFAGGFTLAALGTAVLPIVMTVLGLFGLGKLIAGAFKGGIQTADGKMYAASDTNPPAGLSGRPVIQTPDGLAFMDPNDVPIKDPVTGAIYYTNSAENVIAAGNRNLENNIISSVMSGQESNVAISGADMRTTSAATNKFSTAVSEFTTTTAAAGASSLQLSDEQIEKLAKKLADGAQSGIERADLKVQGSVNVDGRRFGSLVTDVMKGNALGRS